MNILVTGANGQLGSEIKKVSFNTSPNKYIFCDSKALNITEFSSLNQFLDKNNIHLIINCAAYTQVDRAEEEAEAANLVNHVAVAHLAKVAKDRHIKLIHISTDYVFDGSRNIPYTEDVPTSPLGIYGITKLKGEQAIKASDCEFLIFRTSWLYSEFGNNFVKTISRLISEREKLSVVFDQVGTPTNARDLAEFICHIIETEKYKINNGIYHFSNEGVCSWYDFAKEISFLKNNTKCNIQPCHSNEFPSKVTRPAYSVLDKSKLKQDFDYNIKHWKESLKEISF